jgi:hypothetical protein
MTENALVGTEYSGEVKERGHYHLLLQSCKGVYAEVRGQAHLLNPTLTHPELPLGLQWSPACHRISLLSWGALSLIFLIASAHANLIVRRLLSPGPGVDGWARRLLDGWCVDVCVCWCVCVGLLVCVNPYTVFVIYRDILNYGILGSSHLCFSLSFSIHPHSLTPTHTHTHTYTHTHTIHTHTIHTSTHTHNTHIYTHIHTHTHTHTRTHEQRADENPYSFQVVAGLFGALLLFEAVISALYVSLWSHYTLEGEVCTYFICIVFISW